MQGDIKSKPILFNTAMVQAILDGRKTVTRRVLKPHREAIIENVWLDKNDSEVVVVYNDNNHIGEKGYIKPPYQVGDIIYVRETFAVGKVDCGEEPDGRDSKCYISQCEGETDIIPKEWAIRSGIGIEDVIWKPSIFMPKEAARIFLKVTDVRVERLQDIDDEQAKAEGANFKNGKNVGWEEKMRKSAIDRFSELWNSTIHKKHFEKLEWDANPWVWVVEFERCENA
jgi:hypothetical protein